MLLKVSLGGPIGPLCILCGPTRSFRLWSLLPKIPSLPCSTNVPFPPLLASIIPARIRYSFITTSSLRRKEFVWSRIHDQRFQQNGGLMWKEVRLHFLHLLFTSTICCCFLLCLPLTNSLFFLELLLLLLPGPLPPPPPAPLLLLLLFGSVAIVVAVVVVTVVIMISTEKTND